MRCVRFAEGGEGEEEGDAVLLPRNALLRPLTNRKEGLDDGVGGDSSQWDSPAGGRLSQGS